MVTYKFNQPYYELHFSELDENAIHVASFEAEEKISDLFEYSIKLVSEDASIDSSKILNKPATFIFNRGDENPIKVNGIISSFEQYGRTTDYVFYKAVLVPRLWRLNLVYQNEIYQNMDIKQLIETILDDVGLSGQDYKIDLKSGYSNNEYIVQYRESDFNFLNRRLEHLGIYYYFLHENDKDVVVFTDSNSKLPRIGGEEKIGYNQNKDPFSEKESVMEIQCRERVVTGSVQLKDYNYMFPEKQLMAQSQLDDRYPGVYYDFGDHLENEKDAESLAKVRNQEILAESKIFYGKSDCRHLTAGHKFSLERHYRDDWNGEYIITEVSHIGNQESLFALLPQSKRVSSTYENNFEAIPVNIEFRPKRKTPKPKISGIMTAKVDAAGDGKYASIDDRGRYKVKIPFDLSDKQNGEASHYIRMAQPYAGADYGMHFPLHKGTEVLLTFVDGNPDRPIIASAVPNPETSSPVKGVNQTKSVIRTGGGNQIAIEDSDGGQQISLSSPTESSKISIGAPNEGNIFINTVGNMVTKVSGPLKHVNNGDTYIRHGSTYKYECDGPAVITFKDNVHQTTVGNTTEKFIGTKNSTVIAATDETFVGTKTSKSLASTDETFVGTKTSKSLASTTDLFVGVKKSLSLALSVSLTAGASIEITNVKKLNEAPINEITGKAAVKITCGGSSIEMTPGSIKINSPSVLISSSGGMVRMNGNVTVGGKTAFTDNVSMDEKLKVNGVFDHPSINGKK